MPKPLFKPNGQFNGSLPDPVKPPEPLIIPNKPIGNSQEAEVVSVEEMSFDFFHKKVPSEIVDIAHELLDYAEEIEFVNHNTKHGEEYATLGDLIRNPKMFNNNCAPVTWAVIEQIGPLPAGYSSSPVTLQYYEGVHVAVQLTNHENGEVYILDYTAKQYWDKLPIPFVTTRKTWERVIDNYVALLYKDKRVE